MTVNKENMAVEKRENMRGGEKFAEITKLSDQLPGNMRLFATIRLIPGASIGYHVHENEAELFYFVSGEGTVTDDDKKVAVKAGDSMITFSGHGHAVENSGKEDLILVAAIVKE